MTGHNKENEKFEHNINEQWMFTLNSDKIESK